MSYFFSFLIFFAAFYLQVSVLGSVEMFGFVPNVLLLTFVVFAFYREMRFVIPFILFFGFLLDILFSANFGFYLIFFFAASWAANFSSAGGKLLTFSRLASVVSINTFVFLILSSYPTAIDANLFIQFVLRIGANVFMVFIIYRYAGHFFDFLNRLENISKQKIRV